MTSLGRGQIPFWLLRALQFCAFNSFRGLRYMHGLFLTKKSSTHCLRCGNILLCLLLPASALPEWFLWLALVDRKPSDLPPPDQGLPSTPHHPQMGGSGSCHDNHFTPLISRLKKNGRMLLQEWVLWHLWDLWEMGTKRQQNTHYKLFITSPPFE